MSDKILLAAGGTGGHVFPAQALAEALLKEGYEVSLMTDLRGEQLFKGSLPIKRYVLPMGRLPSHKILRSVFKLWSLFLSFLKALYWVKKLSPRLVIGFGGYPALPTLLAALCWRIPTLLHEQNAILGRTNRFLAPFVSLIALPFKKVKRAERFQAKVVYTGNPVREEFLTEEVPPYKAWRKGEAFKLVIIGGSQGARVFTHVVPQALIELKDELPFDVIHQCRVEDVNNVKGCYRDAKIKAQVLPFIENVAEVLKEAHLIIARSGASTVSELLILNRPALLVPFQGAMDNHQALNAQELISLNKAWMVEEKEFSSIFLKKFLKNFAKDSTKVEEAFQYSCSDGETAIMRLIKIIKEHF